MKILYKVINALSVLAIIPALLFLPMFRFIATVDVASSSNQLVSVLGGLLGSVLDINAVIEKAIGINFEKLPEFYTIQEVIELFGGETTKNAFADFDTAILPDAMKIFFTMAFVLFTAAIVFALLTLISGIFAKKLTVPSIFSVLGIASVFGAKYSFTYVADQLVSGKISVVSILQKLPALESYQNYIKYLNFDIRIFELSKAFNALILIFAIIVAVNIIFKIAVSVSDN